MYRHVWGRFPLTVIIFLYGNHGIIYINDVK
jgi:hypothetical protein